LAFLTANNTREQIQEGYIEDPLSSGRIDQMIANHTASLANCSSTGSCTLNVSSVRFEDLGARGGIPQIWALPQWLKLEQVPEEL